MERRWTALLVRETPPPLWTGALVAVALVALSTALVYPLAEVAPVVSLGVVYLLAVLLVAANWGLLLSVPTAVICAGAYNFFHIPPTGAFSIEDPENWVALGAFLLVAVIASAIAQLARDRAADATRRRREADLTAEMAQVLLRGAGNDLPNALAEASARLSQGLHLPWAEIRPESEETSEGRACFALREGTHRIGTLSVPPTLDDATLSRVQERIVPSLENLLAAARERERLQTEVVETQALRRSDVIKTALLRTVSHDLRSPLTAILASAQAVGSPNASDAERAELADGITEEATRLSRLVDNLLDLSRLEAGAVEPRTDWVAVDEVLRAAADDLGGSGFSFALDPSLPLVRADAAMLERALANLLENARRHSGGHDVSVRARGVGRRLLVRIVDRGPGIPPAQLDRVFEPFYRVQGPEKDGHRGSGLGLAIARGLLEANQATVHAESLPGQGTSFVVELPVPDREPEPADPAATAAG